MYCYSYLLLSLLYYIKYFFHYLILLIIIILLLILLCLHNKITITIHLNRDKFKQQFFSTSQNINNMISDNYHV